MQAAAASSAAGMLRVFSREGGIRKVKKAPLPLIDQWRIVRGDTVQLLAGPDKKKQGKVVKVLKDSNRVVVEGLNLVRHVCCGGTRNAVLPCRATLPSLPWAQHCLPRLCLHSLLSAFFLGQVRKHVRPVGETAGGVFSVESPIHYSNVALVDPVTGYAPLPSPPFASLPCHSF
jgi:ribosomal protein L24